MQHPRGTYAALIDKGDCRGAMVQMDNALKQGAKDPLLHYNRGVCLTKLGKPDEAAAAYQNAGNLPEARNNLGALLREQGRLDEAAVNLRQAIKLKDWADPYYNLGQIALTKREYDAAISYFKHAAKLNPQDGEIYLGWAAALHRMNRLDEALKQFEQALKLLPKSATLQVSYGKLLLDNKSYKEAIAAFKEAIKLDPKNTQAWRGWAQSLAVQEHYKDALALAQKGLRQLPGSAELQVFKGQVYQRLNQLDRAVESYKSAIKADAEFVKSYWLLASTLAQLKRCDEAGAALVEHERRTGKKLPMNLVKQILGLCMK